MTTSADATSIVVATGNAHKVTELQAIAAAVVGPQWAARLVSVAEHGGMPPVVEDEITFAGNARKKAIAVAAQCNAPALADDSGLAVKVLGGAPGIFSARWAGQHGNDAANRELLLAQLTDVPDVHREAEFVCVIAIAHPDGRCAHFTGRMPGRIAAGETGSAGFGYDPIFVPQGMTLTAAELTPEAKNQISHRYFALRSAKAVLLEL